jgi:hypothetical protein
MEKCETRSRICDAKIQIRDPGWKKNRSGINIADPQHCLKIKVGLILYPFGAGAFRGEMMIVIYICAIPTGKIFQLNEK